MRHLGTFSYNVENRTGARRYCHYRDAMIWLVCLVLTAGATAVSTLAQTTRWPEVRSVKAERAFLEPGANDTDTPFVLALVDQKGLLVYRLACHNGNYEDSSEINFPGDFQCALFAIDKGARTSWNLLATDEPSEQSSDWFNRGRMTAGQLWGTCASNPEYGARRRFHLRGMILTFEFKDIRWDSSANTPHRLERFTFSIAVAPDPAATTATTERVAAPRPSASCQ